MFWPEKDAVPTGPRPGPDERRVQRTELPVAVSDQGEPELHPYDVSTLGLGDEAVHYALDAQPLVEAKTARTLLVGRLSLAFALTPQGLGVFDRDRRLVQFNPAFIEQTGLSASVASEGPTLDSVLGSVATGRAVPGSGKPSPAEPDRTWDERLMASWDGVHAVLTDGTSLRLIGRALPDGALLVATDRVESAASPKLPQPTDPDARLRSVVRLMDDPALVVDPDHRIVATSKAYDAGRRLLGPAEGSAPDLPDELAIWRSTWATGPLLDLLRTGPTRPVRLALAPLRPHAASARLHIEPLGEGAVLVRWLSGWPPTARAVATEWRTKPTHPGAMQALRAETRANLPPTPAGFEDEQSEAINAFASLDPWDAPGAVPTFRSQRSPHRPDATGRSVSLAPTGLA